MEQNNIKRGRGRPRILTDEERKKIKLNACLKKSGILKYVIQVLIIH